MEDDILFIDQYNKVGGGQSVLIDLLHCFKKLGFKCQLAIPKGGYVEKRVIEVTFHYLPDLNLNNGKKSLADSFKLLFHYLKVFQINNKIKATKYVYVNGPRYFIFFYLFSGFFKSKYIYHVHLNFSESIKNLLLKIYAKDNTHAVVFTTNFIKNEFLTYCNKKGGGKLEKLKVLEPCFSEKYGNLAYRKQQPSKTGTINVVSVGRVIPEKGFDLLISLSTQWPLFNFFIIGGPEHDALEYYNHLIDIAPPNVQFVGSNDNIPEFIERNNIDVAIIPSNWNEPFGIVAIELMMCSCLTFVRNKGGLKEIAEKTGALLFEDITELSQAIERLSLMTYDERNEIAYLQYIKTREHYNMEGFLKKLKENIIEE